MTFAICLLLPVEVLIFYKKVVLLFFHIVKNAGSCVVGQRFLSMYVLYVQLPVCASWRSSPSLERFFTIMNKIFD